MCIKLSETSKFDFNLSSKEELYLNVGGGFSRRRKIIEKRLKKEINFRSLSTKSRMSKARLKLNLFDLISCGQHNFKKVMINSTLFAFLVLFAGALSKNSEQRDINGLRGRRDTDDKLWTFESAEKNGRTILNPNYVYELKSDISSSINNQSDRTLMMRDLTSIDGEDEEDNDTSASMLKPSHKSNVGPTKSPNNNNHGLEQLENVSSNHTKGYNNKSSIASNNTKVKKSKSKYLKSPSRKVSLSSFLPKSKRQDSSKVVIPSNENNRTKVEQIANSRSYEPFLSTSGVPSQPLIPYPTGSSLMFGPSTAQIPLPTFFNFPQAHPLPIMSLNNQHHPNHQPRIPLHGINPYEAQNTAQMIEQLQKHIRLETTRHNERPFIFPSSELQTGQHQHQHQQPQQQQQQPEPQRVQPQPQPQLQPQQQPQPVQQQQVFKRDEPKNNYDSMKSSSVQNPDISSHQASATMGSPSAAVALLSERAKSLLSQMSLSNQLAASHLHLTPTNIRNNRDTTSSNIKQSSTNDMGLSSMIKTAAEQWAAKNTGTDSTPTIIVEHDGPTITSVDFNGNNNLPQAQPIQPQLVENNQSDPPEDDDVTSFYSEENEETEGSNDAKRIVKFKQHQHPFMQQSNVVQSDSPFGEDFFDANNGIFGAKRMVPVVGNHQVSNQHSANNNRNPSNDISQDYVRFHKYLDQSPATYPDSINAIKEQSGRDNELISVVSNKIDVTDKEQVDQLIRELQNLNRRRRKNEGSPEIDSDLDSDSRRVKSFNIDDSDDYKGNRNNDDDEDEQIRLIRKKLLARLNRKRKAKFESDSDPASSYVSDQAIKIPLHALLLAALDRRMSSPSEQTRIVDISDGKNKNTLKNNQISFSSPIMNANNVVETTMKTRNGPKMRANTAGILRAFNRSDAASNLSQLKNPDIFYILDNFGFPGALSAKSRGNNSSSDAVIDVNSNRGSRSGSNYINNNLNNNNNTYNDGNTDYDRSKDGEGNQSQSTDQEQQNISATTRTPTATTASETFQRRPPDKESARQQESQQQEQDNDTTKGTSTRESGAKGRRDVAGGNDEGNNDGNRGTDNDGDFDVDKQVNEFSNDRNESPLEPSWARNGINKQQERNRKRNDPSVDFDDDFEDLASKSAASNTRKRVLKRRRLPPKLREGAYEQSGNNFLNKLDKDTADSGGEIDRNTLGIDDPIVPENEDQRVQQNREDDDLHEDDDKDRHRDDDGDGESNERRPEENDNNRSGAETRTNQIITWKPHMIDDEVRRIEIIAERRRAGRDKQEQLERRRGNRKAYQ